MQTERQDEPRRSTGSWGSDSAEDRRNTGQKVYSQTAVRGSPEEHWRDLKEEPGISVDQYGRSSCRRRCTHACMNARVFQGTADENVQTCAMLASRQAVSAGVARAEPHEAAPANPRPKPCTSSGNFWVPEGSLAGFVFVATLPEHWARGADVSCKLSCKAGPGDSGRSRGVELGGES